MGKAVKILAALGEGTKSIVFKIIFWYPTLSLLYQFPVLLIPKSGQAASMDFKTGSVQHLWGRMFLLLVEELRKM
jgi:hypothetical protein